MVGVVLTALRRFHALTGDPRVGDAIVGGVRWLIAKTYVPEAGHFRYTSCVNHTGPGPAYTLQIIEGLADACMFSPDPIIAAVLRRALPDVGQPDPSALGGPR